MIREAEERRNLALVMYHAQHKPEDIDKVFPVEKPAEAASEGFVTEQWWEG